LGTRLRRTHATSGNDQQQTTAWCNAAKHTCAPHFQNRPFTQENDEKTPFAMDTAIKFIVSTGNIASTVLFARKPFRILPAWPACAVKADGLYQLVIRQVTMPKIVDERKEEDRAG
jgi:hypothetical protein